MAIKKILKIRNVVFCAFLITLLTTTYSLSFGAFAENKPLQILYLEENDSLLDSNMLLKSIATARGEIEVKGNKNFKLTLAKDLIKESKNDYDAIAVPYKIIDEEMKNSIQEYVNRGKLIYIYGDSLDRKTVEDILGIKPVSIDEATKEKGQIKENAKSKNINYEVIGFKKGKVSDIYLGNIVTDSKLDQIKFVDSIIDNINDKYADDNVPLITKQKAEAEATSVDAVTDINTNLWIGDTKVASLNEDLFLKQELDETDEEYDYFVLKHSAELVNYNGAENKNIWIGHSLPYSSVDNIEDWDPTDSTGSNFEISLPWGASWSFSNSASISIDATGSATNDYASWFIDKRWYQSQLVSPCRVKPGTAWLSVGTLAVIDTEVNAYVTYNGNDELISSSYEYEYNY
ncbi:MAG: hypothetical protein A4E55_00210 [Pelotomaculum sp. PtaU1.Bin035]|nr:MAG: hypothetical protein A4E55_00210 [Pelotomaculum sp. PtaU1.Bin035]